MIRHLVALKPRSPVGLSITTGGRPAAYEKDGCNGDIDAILRLSLLKSLSGLGVGLAMKIATDGF